MDQAPRRGTRTSPARGPIALISLVNMGMSVTDTIMVSALFGTEALAAVAVGSDLYSIVFYLCAGVLACIAPFYTAAVAKANALERARVERIGWMTVGLLAVSAAPLIWLAPGWLEDSVSSQQALLTDGQGYTRAMALTLVPMLGVILYRIVLTAAEKPKVFLRVTLAIGNYVFMIGIGPITLGAADVAAHTLTLRTAGVVYALPAALLQASMVRMARAESLHDAGACRALIFSSLGLSAIFGTGIFLMLAVTAEPFATAFFDDSAVGIAAMQIAVVLLILLGLVEFLIGPGSAAAGLLRGRKDTRAPMIYVLVGHWAVGAPLGIYLCESYGLGAIGIWIGLAAGTFLTTLLTLARLFARKHVFVANSLSMADQST